MAENERLTEKTAGCFGYDLKDLIHKNGEFADYNAFYSYNMAVKRLGEYEEIGTVEEFKALKEKAEPKKPLLRLCGDCQRGCVNCDRYEDKCPTCNGGLYVESGKPHEYCPHCGQKLDWGE